MSIRVWNTTTLCVSALALIGMTAPLRAADAGSAGLVEAQDSTLSFQPFWLKGLISPAAVSKSIFVSAPSIPAGATFDYFIDEQLLEENAEAPYCLGGQIRGQALGFDTSTLPMGSHTLQAIAEFEGVYYMSDKILLTVVPAINANFSQSLSPYANQPSAQQSLLLDTLAHTTTAGAALSANEQQTRLSVLSLYLNWGIDPSLDYGNFQSQLLMNLEPSNWAGAVHSANLAADAQLFSPDSVFYQPVPQSWARVPLPSGYIQTIQLNTAQQGDGIGYGLVFSGPNDPVLPLRVEWYGNPATLLNYWVRAPWNWQTALPWQTYGDEHMIFVDTTQQTFMSTYKTSADPAYGIDALAAGGITSLNTLGDRGGSTASRFAELPVLLRAGEATNPQLPIPHALGGPVHRTWMARVYPATGWDYGLESSQDSCTGAGYTNTGLVPYGGLIQLDPSLNLAQLSLTLPAFRILQAMQQYGYYVMDYGCADLDIYTSISEEELNPFGGLWGYNKQGPGVQNEVQKVLSTATLYVVAPLVKKQ